MAATAAVKIVRLITIPLYIFVKLRPSVNALRHQGNRFKSFITNEYTEDTEKRVL